MIRVTPAIVLDDDEIELHFVRAGGPGGQHVNKVATAVQLRFDVGRSPSLPEAVRERIVRLGGRRVTTDRVVVIDARRFRSQDRNRADALARLVALIRKAAQPPRRRRTTRPSAAEKKRRLADKRRRGALKDARRPGSPTED